jgi:DNA invertase Pin-like site-specific DNA recombinase
VLESGDAKALVVAKLERLSQALLDLATLMATAQKQGWAVVALDCALDPTAKAVELNVVDNVDPVNDRVDESPEP